MTVAEIADEVQLSRPTVCYHLRRAGEKPEAKFNHRYDWAAVQAYYADGNAINACIARFGMSRKSFHDACRRGDVRTRPQAMPLEQLLAGRRSRGHLKQRLIRLGLKENSCEVCSLSDWLGAPLSMALHHINGDGHDNGLENLQLLCPNCHSQTENFSGRKRGRSLVQKSRVESV